MPEITRSSDGGWRAALVWDIGIIIAQKLLFPVGYLELGETWGLQGSGPETFPWCGEGKGERSGDGEPALGVEWEDSWEASSFP